MKAITLPKPSTDPKRPIKLRKRVEEKRSVPVMVRVAKHRKRIAARSRSMAGKMRKYNKRRPFFLQENPFCQCPTKDCPTKQHPSTEIHHTRGRAGALLLDERYWRAVCRRSHNWIGENPNAARQRGYIAQRGEWGKVERAH